MTAGAGSRASWPTGENKPLPGRNRNPDDERFFRVVELIMP
ncbi:Uncharacterized protein pbN1_27700 [Aromatoleum bremense]|nr:Uncharacterized protein pbN1_27700 [Aromatoleum bremense]